MEQLNDASNAITTHMEIDDRLLAIATIDKQIADYEALKKHRVASIERELEWLEKKRTEHRDAIQTYMRDNGEKALNYPGVAKVARKLGKGKWIVKDEDALIQWLYQHVDPAVLAKVIVAKPKIVKKELDPVLTDLANSSALDCDAAEFEASSDVLTITFDKGDGLQSQIKDLRDLALPEEPKYERDIPAVAKVATRKMDYDALEL